jgi:hypothetical protein
MYPFVPSRPPEGDGGSLTHRRPPPSPCSFPRRRRRQRSPGDAGGGGSPFPVSERAGWGPPLPGGGAHRATRVRRGRVKLAAVPSRRRGSTAATPASARPCWTPRPQMGSGGPRWARVGWVLQRFGLAGGGDDGLAGVLGRRLCGQRIAARQLVLHEPIWARPGLSGPGVLPLLCLVSDCLSAVEVGSSRVAARLLFLVPTVPCTSVVQAVGQCHEATGDGDFKIVVAHAGGRQC